MPPDKKMWDWVNHPVMTGKPLPADAPTAEADPMKMRKVDLKLHHLPGEEEEGESEDGENLRGVSPVGAKDKDDKKGKGGKDAPSLDPAKDERDQTEKELKDAKTPAADRAKDAMKEVLKKYAEENLGKLKQEALDQLAKAWSNSPGGVISVGAIIGAAGVAYLVKSGANIPDLPPIPLDFLAKRAPAFKGAEFKLSVKGPITGPQSFMVSITFHEQGGKSGKGKGFALRLSLEPNSVKAAGVEPGSKLEIAGKIYIPKDAKPEDVTATIKALNDAKVETLIAGTPTYSTKLLSAADNYKPGAYGLNAPPMIRFLTARLETSLPPMFHDGKDEVGDADVSVEINHIKSDGNAEIKVHFQPRTDK